MFLTYENYMNIIKFNQLEIWSHQKTERVVSYELKSES